MELSHTANRKLHDITDVKLSDTSEEFSRFLSLMPNFQKKLVKLYQAHVINVAPLLRLHQDLRNVNQVYVTPCMKIEEKNEVSQEWKEDISICEIFRNKEKPAKNIYIIGEAGSGKSFFCKFLVSSWCIAHSNQECSIDQLHIVKEMQNFEFLFYVSLRYCSKCESIETMLEKSYSDPALRDILRNKSSECLIILDGLDEWNPERKHNSQFLTPGLPGRELYANYTIITTSRQWKFDALPISDGEVDNRIKLRGISDKQMRSLTEKTVETLNDIYKKNKNAYKCIADLRSRDLSEISHTPLVLQQLICLWFNDNLRDISKCAIYKNMLELFLEWKTLGTSEIQEQLHAIKFIRRKTSVTQYLSYLAYETLFDKNKETTLAFSSSTLIQLSIPHDVINDCLACGILKEERNVSLCESTQSSIAFFHKSMQEYLAAVYIASQFEEMLKSQKDEHDLTDVCKKCVGKYFGSCTTVVDILEQSNVLQMLCGLEPRLLTNVNEFIYYVTLVDKMVVEERNTVPEHFSSDHHKMIKDIQTCILKCIEEVKSIAKNVHSPVYIANLYVNYATNLLPYVHNIILKNVLSIEIVGMSSSIICKLRLFEEYDEEAFYLAVKHLTKCDQLKVIKFSAKKGSDERIYKEVTKILKTNFRTLETVSLLFTHEGNITCFVSLLPKMRLLTSLQLYSNDKIPHDVCLALGKFLNQTKSLKHISLGFDCDKHDEHMIDLSKHKQLHHVELIYSTFCMVNCISDNLETCKLSITSVVMMKQVCKSLCQTGKLKYLDLHFTKYIATKKAAYRTITKTLIRLLLSLASLSALKVGYLTFTDNIIERPFDMKSLKKITLHDVTMSLTTWYKFIDSLSELPQVVTVKTSGMGMRDETLSEYRKRDKNQEEDPHQYVRGKTNLFHVTHDDTYNFLFTSKKVFL